MVAKSGGYYGSYFQGFRVVTQGDLMSLTLFNVLINAVARHWV